MKLQIVGSALAAAMLLMGGQAVAANGKAVYEASCAACHATGAAGAPKTGDKAVWAARLKDTAALQTAALKGKGVMPPKGGNASLSDADVIAAVDYMIAQSK